MKTEELIARVRELDRGDMVTSHDAALIEMLCSRLESLREKALYVADEWCPAPGPELHSECDFCALRRELDK